MSRVAIVGSGAVGANLALDLATLGHDVTVFEKGPDYPYPHTEPFLERVRYNVDDPRWAIGEDLKRIDMTGDYRTDLTDEVVARVGGAATKWTGLTMRMREVDFKTRSALGYADDWPLTYADVEPWYCAAEERMGVSGTDDDNPWAPPRSRPYPLPPFELTWDDRMLAERLAKVGLHVHTTPQARLRHDYGGRPGCQNYNSCSVCPVGARYSPTFHLQQAVATGRVTVRANVSVRRIVTDASGRARALLVRAHDAARDEEFAADQVVIAAGAFESARLLLLSTDARHPNGLGNASGQVGRNLTFHHIWAGHVHYREKLWAGRLGPWTGQSEQYCNPEGRGRIGGVKVEFPSSPMQKHIDDAAGADTVERALAIAELSRRCRRIAIHAEAIGDDGKYVQLAKTRDRFGDPRIEVHYDLSDFDRHTYDFGRDLFERFAHGSGGTDWEYPPILAFGIFNHYAGTCRMSESPADGVVNAWGEVHGTPGLWVLGLSTFVNPGGALNPTLTGLALALRSVARLHDRLRGA